MNYRFWTFDVGVLNEVTFIGVFISHGFHRLKTQIFTDNR